MSQENVELVTRIVVPDGVDLATLMKDDVRLVELYRPRLQFFHEDCETIARGWPTGEKSYHGILDQRRFWEDWLAPWAEYRQELWKTVDLGDRVLVLFHDFGRRADSTHEVKGETAGIWTVRDGQVVRIEFFLDPDEALRAAGLED